MTPDWSATVTLDMTPDAQEQYEAESFAKIAGAFARFHGALLNVLPQRVADAILLQWTTKVIASMYECDE